MNASVIHPLIAAALEELALLEAADLRSDAHGALAGRALLAAGTVLRRSARAGEHRARAEALLTRLPAAALRAWAAAVPLGEVEARLRRATEEAVEAALPESEGEGVTWAGWAEEGLEARDALQSQLVALRLRERLAPMEGDSGLGERLAAAVAALDNALRPRSRWLVGLNPRRREERDGLDPQHRADAWWFTERSECDALLPALAGERRGGPHLDDCPDCQRDLQAVHSANAPAVRHLSEDDLWSYDLGTLSAAQRAFVDRHAAGCSDCSLALAALEEGEDAIAALTAPRGASPPATATVVDIRDHQRRSEQPEVLAAHAGFRLLLFRGRQRPALVVQPLGGARIVAAALHLTRRPQHALAARAGAEGWQFELGDGGRISGAVRIRVRLAGASRDVELDAEV